MFDRFLFSLRLGAPFENTVEVIECNSADKCAA
jgi:hypothetical protein